MTGPDVAATEKAALAYAAHGWHVFVLSARKVPIKLCDACDVHTTPEQMESCTCLTCHGFYAATTDPVRITEMVRRNPRGPLAMRTGAISGVAVVDVDFKTLNDDGSVHRGDLGYLTLCELDRKKLLPGTLMQATGSGGIHFFYGHPGGYLMSGAKRFGTQVDSKADGAYVVLSPSVNARGRPYAWTGDGRFDHPLTPMPEALCALLRPPEPVRRPEGSQFAHPGGTRGRLAGLLRTILDAQEGGRNDMLHWAAKKAGEMVATGEVEEAVAVAVLQDAARRVGLPDNEIGDANRGTIASGLRKGRAAA